MQPHRPDCAPLRRSGFAPSAAAFHSTHAEEGGGQPRPHSGLPSAPSPTPIRPGRGAKAVLVLAVLPDLSTLLIGLLCASVGFVAWRHVAVFALAAAACTTTFIAIEIWRRKRGGSLPLRTMLHMGIGLLPTLYLLYHMDHVAGRAAIAVLGVVPVTFSVLVLNRTRMLTMAFILAGGYTATVYAAHHWRLGQPITPGDGVVIFVLFVASIAICFIGGYVYSVRLHVHKKAQQLKEATEHLAALAKTDELTGLPNRRAIMQRLEAAKLRHLRDGLPFCVVLFDIDHFKCVNDTLGHSAGDAVLRRIAKALPEVMRTTDVLGRHGGEEFLAILTQTTLSGAHDQAERMRKALEHMRWDDISADLHISASFGVAQSHAGFTEDSLLALADQALYRAKHTGRNRVVLASATTPPSSDQDAAQATHAGAD